MSWLVDIGGLSLASNSRQLAILLVGVTLLANVLYWITPSEVKTLITTGLGFVGLALLSPASALVLEAIVLTVFLGLKDRRRTRILAYVLALVLVFALYQLALRAASLDQKVALVGFVYAIPRAVHVLVDSRYRQMAPPSLGLLHAYFWFFPTLIIGPIHRLDSFRRSLRRRRFDAVQLGYGLERILVGLLSVKVLADWLTSVRFHGWAESSGQGRPGLKAMLSSVEYGLNLYFTFAGWTAVAIGVAAVFGFRVNENFDRPFFQRNLADFWRSWHMSLTSWTRDYVYQPIVATTRRPAVAVVATMFAIALWHEFSSRYLAWALWHAAGLVVHRWFTKQSSRRPTGTYAPAWIPPRVRRITATSLTVSFVALSFTLTRSSSLSTGLTELATIFTGSYW